jgi:hypothetical protein
MAVIVQFLLVSCLAVGLYAQEGQEAEVISSEILESYFGVEEIAAVRIVSAPEGVEVEGGDTTPETPRERGRGGHGGRRGGHHGRGYRGHRGRSSGNWTSEQKMEHICRATQSAEVGRKERWMAAKLARLEPAARERLTALLAARKTEMQQCCSLTGSARAQCGETMSQQRYDRVCAGEESLCVWAAIRGSTAPSSDTSTAPSSDTSTCCASTGQPRYDCFAAARRSYGRRHGSRRI